MKSKTQVTGYKSHCHLPLAASEYCRKLFLSVFFLMVVFAHNTYACAVCFGDKDSLQTKGTMAGVLFLLVVIVSVLGGFAVTFVRWGMRERAIQEKLGPPSSEPGHS